MTRRCGRRKSLTHQTRTAAQRPCQAARRIPVPGHHFPARRGAVRMAVPLRPPPGGFGGRSPWQAGATSAPLTELPRLAVALALAPCGLCPGAPSSQSLLGVARRAPLGKLDLAPWRHPARVSNDHERDSRQQRDRGCQRQDDNAFRFGARRGGFRGRRSCGRLGGGRFRRAGQFAERAARAEAGRHRRRWGYAGEGDDQDQAQAQGPGALGQAVPRHGPSIAPRAGRRKAHRLGGAPGRGASPERRMATDGSQATAGADRAARWP